MSIDKIETPTKETTAELVETTKHVSKLAELEKCVRDEPLLDRLEKSRSFIGKMCSQGRPPKMSIPVHYQDEDFYMSTTLKDAIAAVKENAELTASRSALERECERLRDRVSQLQDENDILTGITMGDGPQVDVLLREQEHWKALLARVAEAVRSACGDYLELKGQPAFAHYMERDVDVQAIIKQVTGKPVENLLALADVLAVIHSIAANYPADIWPDDGDTPDCKGAKMARLTCANIERELRALIAGEATSEQETQ